MSRNAVFSIVTAMVLFLAVHPASALEVGVAWVGKSGMANRVTAGFEQVIKAQAPDIHLEYRRELDTPEDLAAAVAAFQKEKQGMVILRSNGAKWLGQHPPAIPTFIGGCNNPVQLGALKNMEAPQGNITGVTYFLPVATQFETFRAILPNMNSLLLLYGEGNPSADIDRQQTRSVCENLGLTYEEKGVTAKDQAVAAMQQYAGKVSFAIIGSQAAVIDNAKAIVAAAGSTPVVSYSSKPVKDGALGGFVADDHRLGGMLAESVIDVLLKKKPIRSVPVKVDPNPTFYVNAGTAGKLGLEIPYEVLQAATVIE